MRLSVLGMGLQNSGILKNVFKEVELNGVGLNGVGLNGVGLNDIPMFLSSGLVAILCPEITSSVARLMPAYSFG